MKPATPSTAAPSSEFSEPVTACLRNKQRADTHVPALLFHFRMSIQLVVVSAVRAAVAAAITMRSSASQTLRFMIQD